MVGRGGEGRGGGGTLTVIRGELSRISSREDALQTQPRPASREGNRGDMGPVHKKIGEILVLFKEVKNRGNRGPVPREQGDIGHVHGEQGRYGSCLYGTGELWVLFIRNRADMGPVHGEQGRYGTCL